MSNNQTIKGKNLNADLVTLSDKPSIMDSGAKYVYVGYNSKNLVVQTPEMSMPFGFNVYDKGEYPKYSVDLSFDGMDTNKSMKSFHDNLEAMDERLISEGMKNSLNWFKKKSVSREVVASLFNKQVKAPMDKNGEPLPYPSRLKLKIPYKDGTCLTEFYDKDGTRITEDPSKVLVRGGKVKAIIQCVGLWISASNYMCQWKAVRMEVEIPDTAENGGFLPDTDDEDDDGASSSAAPASSKSKTTVVDSDEEDMDVEDDEDDDDEEEDASESESEPEPEPEPVKKSKGKGKGKGKSSK